MRELFLNDGSTITAQARHNRVGNSTALSSIKGVELGGRIFFDRLPSPWNGFGIEANYTYVDSESPGDVYFDIDGVAHTDAPVRNLSENNYNIQLMFEKPKFGARLAWSWRSEFLLGTNLNGTNGDYLYFPTPNLGAANTIMPTLADIALPTYADAIGQLDFGASYRPTEKLSIDPRLPEPAGRDQQDLHQGLSECRDRRTSTRELPAAGSSATGGSRSE